MKKRIFAALMSLAMAASLLSTAVAAPITAEEGNPNQYVITDALQNFEATDDLWIGTLADWKAEGKEVGSTGTVFENGEAIHEDDIIITNGKVGAVLAVGTRNPWGYPAGSVLDVGAVENWVGDRDTVWSVEVLINGWDSWAPDNCGTVTFDVVKYNFDPAVKAEAEDGQWAVKVSRIYAIGGTTFNVDTYYGISPDANYIMMFDKLANTGDATGKISNRFAMTNKGDDGGAMYAGDALLAIGTYGATDKNVYSTSYVLPGKNTSNLGIDHAWGRIGGSVGYKELRAGDGGKQAYEAGEVVTFDEYIIVSDEPTTEAVSDFMIDYNDATPMTVSGTAKDADGKALANPVVVVEKDGASYAWFMGEADGTFSFQLPEGEGFAAYIEQNGYAKGAEVAITADNAAALELAAGAAKVDVTFNLKDQNGEPVYGKLELFTPDGEGGWESAYPTVRFCGDSVYQAVEEGVINAAIEPGEYKAVVYGEGYWFYSNPVEVIANTADGDQDVVVNMVYDAPDGWYSGDLHHHANKNDAFADPKDAIPSLKAAGLDVAFITDHDFTVNNYKAYELAKQYDIFGFIPSEEISCSWAHFNVIPQDAASWEYFLDENAENHVMNQFGKLQEFVDQTHEKGADITANHPWYSYGLYYADYVDAIPGGYTDDYDNVELNACSEDSENLETILSAVALWTSYQDGTALYVDKDGNPVYTEKAHYIIGGSDTHDVLYPGFAGDDYSNTRAASAYASGKIRTFAYVGDAAGDDVTENGLAFANAISAGNLYTTYGPILTLDKVPGNEYDVDGTFTFTVGVESLADIQDVVVLTKNSADAYAGMGTSAYTEQQLKCDADLSTFGVNAKTGEFTVEVDVARGQQDWVAVVVMDVNGNYAITSPYWLTGTGDYSDVDAQHWAYANVMDVAEKGLMNGVGDGSVFAPATELTRGMAATVLYRMSGAEGGNAAEAAATFSDVAADKWYAAAIDWASDNKIAQGDGATFRPNDTITRQDMVTMLYRYAQFTGADVSAVNDLAAFTDAGNVASYADAAVKWAVGAGIINGRTDTTLVPGGALNRAEFAAIISRYTK